VLRAVVTGAALATLATAIAAVVYFVIEFREFTLKSVLLAPVLESAAIGALAAAGFKLVGARLRGVPFVALATACGCLLGALVGALFVGNSEHFSHDRAVVVLASSWLVVSLVAALCVLSSNISLQADRER
jgi:hydroxyethylthiazole kinase-like sugar kinase family protein